MHRSIFQDVWKDLYRSLFRESSVIPPPPPASLLSAYSVRKVVPAYIGNALRVRRSSDNAEQDIGFSGDDLDTTSLLSFVGAGTGFVTTWYDQKGGNDAVQAGANNQPSIVSAGSLLVDSSGNPTLLYVTRKFFSSALNLGITGNQSFSIYVYFKYNILQPSKGPVRIGNGTRVFMGLNVTTTVHLLGFNVSGSFQSDTPDLNEHLHGWMRTGGGSSNIGNNGRIDAVAQTMGGGGTPFTPNISDTSVQIGTTLGASSEMTGTISELQIFDDELSTIEFTGLETNINAYFTIY